MQIAPMIYGLTKVAYEEGVSATAQDAHLRKVYELAKRINVETHKTPEWVDQGKTESREFLFFGDGSLLIILLKEGKPIRFSPYSHD